MPEKVEGTVPPLQKVGVCKLTISMNVMPMTVTDSEYFVILPGVVFMCRMDSHSDGSCNITVKSDLCCYTYIYAFCFSCYFIFLADSLAL